MNPVRRAPVSARRDAALAVAVVTATALGVYAMVVPGVTVRDHATSVLYPLAVTLFAMVGGVVMLRRPGHRMGTLLFTGGALGTVFEAGGTYVRSRPLPVADPFDAVVVVIVTAVGMPMFLLLAIVIPMMFPDGRLPSRRWRPALWSLATLFVLGWAPTLFLPGPIVWVQEGTVLVANPLGVDAAAQWPTVNDEGGAFLLALFLLLAVASLVVRVRRDPVQRKQIAWVGLAFGGAIGAVLMGTLTGLSTLSEFLAGIAFVLIPIVMGVAITRRDLFEIDRLLGRTLGYTLLTIVLALVYVGTVLTVGAVLPALGSDLAVAGATLVAAALARPLRQRIQRGVDRRFDRARYDASLLVETFSRRLRSEVDLDQVRAELAHTAGAALRPASVSTWVAS